MRPAQLSEEGNGQWRVIDRSRHSDSHAIAILLFRLVRQASRVCCENSCSLSFRGATGDEESRTALKNYPSEIPRFAPE
jgi:hypothetical protein